jgi:putative RNA 2'-phosphotransferase
MRSRIEQDLKAKVSRYMSYLLRHNPENLKMDRHGFVVLDELLDKLNERFQTDKKFIFGIVEKSHRKRFEIVENEIRALYGHTIPVRLELEEDKVARVFYHGTTPDAASKILKAGLKPMKRRRVHLSPTIEIAKEVGLRRTKNPVILEINAEAARKKGLKFYKATDEVYVCGAILPRYIKIATQ